MIRGSERLSPACALTAEHVTDFPFREELRAELRQRLEDLVRETGGDGGDCITRLTGWKLGGRPTWHLSHPTVFACGDCGTTMTLPFTVASRGVAVRPHETGGRTDSCARGTGGIPARSISPGFPLDYLRPCPAVMAWSLSRM